MARMGQPSWRADVRIGRFISVDVSRGIAFFLERIFATPLDVSVCRDFFCAENLGERIGPVVGLEKLAGRALEGIIKPFGLEVLRTFRVLTERELIVVLRRAVVVLRLLVGRDFAGRVLLRRNSASSRPSFLVKKLRNVRRRIFFKVLPRFDL